MLCECGCGQLAPISPFSDRNLGYVKGQPRRFLRGHSNSKHHRLANPNPSGLCMCGCGQPTAIADRTTRSAVLGHPRMFIHGHTRRSGWHVNEITGCWLWDGQTDDDGYGRLVIRGKRVLAHRAVYEDRVGIIQQGLVLDHVCENRRCVNPDHLDPTTFEDNTTRRHRKQDHGIRFEPIDEEAE